MSDQTVDTTAEADENVTPSAVPPAEGTPPPSEEGSSPTSESEPVPPSAPDGGGSDKSLLDDAPEEERPAPTNWPDNWREIMAGGDDKSLKVLNRYSSPSNVFKALRSVQSKMSAGELLRAKPDGSPEQGGEEALNEWRAQAGIPEKPEGYLEKLPDGLVIGKEDEPIINEFVQAMHEADAPPEHVHKALKWYYDHQDKLGSQIAENDRKNGTAIWDELISDYGSVAESKANINHLDNTLKRYGGEDMVDMVASARLPDGSRLNHNPQFMKSLIQMARELEPFETITPSDGKTRLQSIESRKAELEAEMGNKAIGEAPGGYWKSPAKQKEYQELLEAEERLRKKSA